MRDYQCKECEIEFTVNDDRKAKCPKCESENPNGANAKSLKQEYFRNLGFTTPNRTNDGNVTGFFHDEQEYKH